MQQQKSQQDDLTKVTFGVTSDERFRKVTWGALFAGVVAAMIDLSGDVGFWWFFWFVFGIVLLPVGIFYLRGRNEFIIDFATDTITHQTGSYPWIQNFQGSLNDIAAFHIGRRLGLNFSAEGQDTFVFTISILFRKELKRPPLRIDSLPCSVSLYDFRARVRLSLDLARRLNIPVYDDSGWQGEDWRPQAQEPERIVIQPGEMHPVLAPKIRKRK